MFWRTITLLLHEIMPSWYCEKSSQFVPARNIGFILWRIVAICRRTKYFAYVMAKNCCSLLHEIWTSCYGNDLLFVNARNIATALGRKVIVCYGKKYSLHIIEKSPLIAAPNIMKMLQRIITVCCWTKYFLYVKKINCCLLQDKILLSCYSEHLTVAERRQFQFVGARNNSYIFWWKSVVYRWAVLCLHFMANNCCFLLHEIFPIFYGEQLLAVEGQNSVFK